MSTDFGLELDSMKVARSHHALMNVEDAVCRKQQDSQQASRPLILASDTARSDETLMKIDRG